MVFTVGFADVGQYKVAFAAGRKVSVIEGSTTSKQRTVGVVVTNWETFVRAAELQCRTISPGSSREASTRTICAGGTTSSQGYTSLTAIASLSAQWDTHCWWQHGSVILRQAFLPLDKSGHATVVEHWGAPLQRNRQIQRQVQRYCFTLLSSPCTEIKISSPRHVDWTKQDYP